VQLQLELVQVGEGALQSEPVQVILQFNSVQVGEGALQPEPVQVGRQFELVQLQLELVQVGVLAGLIVIVVFVDDPRT
jgi:hypothetical protein